MEKYFISIKEIIMALKLPITAAQSGLGVAFPDAYHRVSFGSRNKSLKICSIIVSVFATAAAVNSNPVLHAEISVTPADFDLYFGAQPNEAIALYPERAAYNFLRSVNPTDPETKYPTFPFNYTNAIDV